MRRINLFQHDTLIPNLNISLEQVNITSLMTRGFDEYDPELCAYLLNHLTIANSLKECTSRAPKDFKIITKNNGEILFNKCLLASISETIFKLIQKDPNINSYKLESDDPILFIQKLSQLLQGETVLFKKEERKPIRKIVGELMISKIPIWLKPKEISLLEKSNVSFKAPQQSKIAISKKSFVSFLSNRIIKFSSKYCYDSNNYNNYDCNQYCFPDNYDLKPFDLQFDEYEKEYNSYNVRAPKIDFEIKTQKNSYKCTLIAALCSDVIFSKIQTDPSIRSFFYDFDDENGSFKVLSDFLNGSLYELGPENLELSIKFATDLGIKPLLTELEKSISAYKLRISNLKSNSYIMNNVLFLQDTLLSITDENVESSYNSIINSVWCDNNEMVKELASNFILVSSILFKNLRPLSKLFKKLISSDSISKKPAISNLTRYFMKNFSFLDVLLENYSSYHKCIDGSCKFCTMQFVLMLKQAAVLTSEDIVVNWPTVSGSLLVTKESNQSQSILSHLSSYHHVTPAIPSYFASEVAEVNAEYNFGAEAMPARARTLYEDEDTVAYSIFSDNLELFERLLSKSEEDDENGFKYDKCIFVPYEYKITRIPMVDFAALCGSARVFNYLAVTKKVTVDYRTLYMSIKGRNGEILKYFTSTFVNEGEKSLLQKLNEDYRNWIYNVQLSGTTDNRADNEFGFANLNLNRTQFITFFSFVKAPQSLLLFSVEMHSQPYFEAICETTTKSEMRHALVRSVECNNFRAFSYIIEKVGILNVYKGIDIIGERCALFNNTDLLRVIFSLFDTEKLIGTSIENPPVLFLNGCLKSSFFYLPSALVAASQTGNIRLTDHIVKTAESLSKRKVLPVLTAAFNSAINRNFDLFLFLVDKFKIVLDDASLVPLLSYLFCRKDYRITRIIYDYFKINGFSQSKVVMNYLAVGAARLNDQELTMELIQKVEKLDNTASFEEVFEAAAVNGNLRLCKLVRKRPITIENIDFVQTVVDMIDSGSLSTLKLFLSMIIVEKRGNAVKNGLLHSIKHNKPEFVSFFVENFLREDQNQNENEDQELNDDDYLNEDQDENENNNETEKEENQGETEKEKEENKNGNENSNENDEDADDGDGDDLVGDVGMNVKIGAIPLIFVNAAFYGHLNVVKAMAALDPSPAFINSIVGDFGSALCAATSSQHEDIVDFLLTLPCTDAYVFNSSNETPLIIAAKNHNFTLFMKILTFMNSSEHKNNSMTFDMKNKDQLNLCFCNFISSFNFNSEYCVCKSKKAMKEERGYKAKISVLPIFNLFVQGNWQHIYPKNQSNNFFNSYVTFYEQFNNKLLKFFLPDYFKNEVDKSDDDKFIQFFTSCDSIDYGFNKYGCNFLIAAVRSKNYELVKLLLNKELTDVNFNDAYGLTAAIHAVINGSIDILKLLIENGEKSEELNKKVDINRQNYCQRTALSYAVYTNNFLIVRYIINLPSFDAEKSNMLLSIATDIICKRKKIALFLLNYSNSRFDFQMHKKMDFYKKVHKNISYRHMVKTFGSFSKTILDIAIDFCNIDLLKALFNHKSFDPTKFNQAKILYLSAASESQEVFQYLLEHFQTSNKKGDNDNLNDVLYDVNFEYKGKSLLFASIYSSYMGITKYIVNHPDFDPIKSNAIAALCKTIIERNFPKMRIVANAKGVDINGQCPQLARVKEVTERPNGMFGFGSGNIENAAGMTPLSVATFNSPNAVRELLDLPGIDVNCRCEDGSTPIFHFNSSDELELLFSQRNLDVNAQNNAGFTCLMNSVFQRNGGFILALMKMGADPLIRDKEGKTLFDYLGPDFKDIDVSNLDWREVSRLILKGIP